MIFLFKMLLCMIRISVKSIIKTIVEAKKNLEEYIDLVDDTMYLKMSSK